jgi:eukaryotic-like serine/threonine-protein kinase
MPLGNNTRLGPYEILAPIGAGGMGEVYRARDSKLGRDVALKVLPEAFARDADRMARFQREAKVLASLNHPNIASIHGLEDSGKTHALVMEMVEGPTLADRIRLGPIPMDETLRIAKQMCEALEYAHERGIVHRDLKPANVKVTSDDAVKVLDFGLAKAIEGDAASTDIANSPTMSRMATLAGVLLGTAAYMSPEQAKGKPVDRRADIWAFGCVLYEMLTGKMAFRGETVTDTLAAVIKEDPDWTQLPAATPVRVRVLLQRCLQKDPKQRLRDIGDARISLEEVLSGAQDPASAAPSGEPAKRWLPWVLGGAAGVWVLALAVLAFLYLRPKPPAGQSMRFEIPLPDKVRAGGGLALSPDGHKLAFIGTAADGLPRIWVRSLETLDAHPLDGTEGANGLIFWSPDSRYIAFPTTGKIKRIDSLGGPSVTVCDTPSALGGAWNHDDEIIFGSYVGVMRVAASGGTPSRLTTGTGDALPFFLPDQRHFVYLHQPLGGSDPGIYVGSMGAKPEDQSSEKLLNDVSAAVYAPSSDPAVGYLVFVRGATGPGAFGTLMAQPFDAARRKLSGDPVPFAEKVPNVSFTASSTGVLVFLKGLMGVTAGGARGIIQGQLTWFDREGKTLGIIGDPGFYRSLAISPDGKRVAFDRADPQNSGTRSLWLYEFARGVTTRFTFGSDWAGYPVWSHDGSRIAFASNRAGEFDLYQKASNLAGEDELLFKSGDNKVLGSWSPGGRFLLFFNPIPPNREWLLPLAGRAEDRKPILLERSDFNQAGGRFSPDGRWIAYASAESGNFEIYVRPFDNSSIGGTPSAAATSTSGKWMVSKDGGNTPLWRSDGKELFYLGADGSAMAVEVNTSGVFQAGIPKALFKIPAGVIFWDVSGDGNKFLMAAPSGVNPLAQEPFTVMLDWQAGMKK